MSNHNDLLNLHSGLDKLPGQNGTNLGHAGALLLLPWAIAHLAYFWLDNFKSYLGQNYNFVQHFSSFCPTTIYCAVTFKFRIE